MRRKHLLTAIPVHALAAFVLLGTTTASVHSAEDRTEISTQDGTTQNTEASTEATEAVRPVKVSAPKKPTKIKAQSAKSADGYEASEEISEDLSVSYPIDI